MWSKPSASLGAPAESSADGSGAATGWLCPGTAPSYLGEHAAHPAAPAAKGVGKAAILSLSCDFKPSACFCQHAER